MAALSCEICGGKLVGKPGGIFECDSCGMEYSTEWAKAKIHEIKGTVRVEGTVEVTGKVQIEGGAVKVEGGINVDSLLKRGHLALEDCMWDDAAKFFDKALNLDAESSEAYFGKLYAKYNVQDFDALLSYISTERYVKHTCSICGYVFENGLPKDLLCPVCKVEDRIVSNRIMINDDPDYQKAIRFLEPADRDQLQSQLRHAEEQQVEEENRIRIEFRRKKEERAILRRAALENERSKLDAEYAGLKGIFTGKRRKEIEVKLCQIDYELENLSREFVR